MELDLDSIFNHDALTSDDGNKISLRRVRAGMLRVPSGALVGFDPLSGMVDPFTRKVTPGTYPMELLFAGTGDEPLAARLVFASARVVTWELAVRAGEDVRTLRAGQYFGAPVDSGVLCFADASGANAFRSEPSAAEDVQTALDGERIATWTDGRGDLIAFATGGDGLYPFWWGLDAHGTPVCLVTEIDLGTEGLVETIVRPTLVEDRAYRSDRADALVAQLIANPTHEAAHALIGMGDVAARHVPALLGTFERRGGDQALSAALLKLVFMPEAQSAFGQWLSRAPLDACRSLFGLASTSSGVGLLQSKPHADLAVGFNALYHRGDEKLGASMVTFLSRARPHLDGVAPLLVAALEHPQERTRREALAALGSLKSKEIERPVRQSASYDPSDAVRVAAVRALAELGLADTVARFFNDANDAVRTEAARMLSSHPQHGAEAKRILDAQLHNAALSPDRQIELADALSEKDAKLEAYRRLAMSGNEIAVIRLRAMNTEGARRALEQIASSAGTPKVRAAAERQLRSMNR